MKTRNARRSFATAFTLVEVALSMGIASFCLIAVLGLVPLGVDTGQMASDQTAAGGILTHVLADLRATPTAAAGTPTSLQYRVPIPPNPATPPQNAAANPPTILYFGNSAQQFSISPGAGTSRYRLTITFPPGPSGRMATGATLLVTWPARVDPANPATGTPTGRVQVFAALDRN